MKKIMIVTLIGLRNYGNRFQNFAMQYTLEQMGFECRTLRFERKISKSKIKTIVLYPFSFLMKGKKKDITIRKRSFLKFDRIVKYCNTAIEKNDGEKIKKLLEGYDYVVYGSDQIWNKHSLELERCGWEYMYPYLLKDYPGRKVSYASSISNMTDEELLHIKGYVDRFDAVSVREISSTKRMEQLLDIQDMIILI